MGRLSRRHDHFLLRADGTTRNLLALDTMCFLYRFESSPAFGAAAGALFECIEQGRIRAQASVLVRVEALVAPLRHERADVAAAWRMILSSFPNLQLRELDEPASDLAAELRARHRVSTPDAIHLATAIRGGADAFVTGDRRLARVTEMEILPLLPGAAHA